MLRLSRKVKNKSIVRQGQRKRHSSKRLRKHSKQNTSKRRRESHCICNANLRRDTTRRACEAKGQRKQHITSHQTHAFCLPHWESHSALMRTVADGCRRLRRSRTVAELRTVAQHPANKASPPHPQDETRTLCCAFGKRHFLDALQQGMPRLHQSTMAS